MSRNMIPTPSQFATYGTNQGAILDTYRRQIEEEIEGLKSGHIQANHRGRAYYLSIARRRLKRLGRLANDFGFWKDA